MKRAKNRVGWGEKLLFVQGEVDASAASSEWKWREFRKQRKSKDWHKKRWSWVEYDD